MASFDPAASAHLRGYRNIRPLAAGGFGRVYVARDESLGRNLAIKVLPHGRQNRAFEREMLAAARLSSHPNVLPIYYIGELEDGSPYVVMEFAPNGTLAARLGRLSPHEIARIGTRLAGAVASLHEEGLVHRDIKPGNVLFNKFDEPLLADFGLATFVGSNTGPSGLTVPFAAPETIEGKKAGPAADIYGLALSLVAAAIGENPQEVELQDGLARGVEAILAGAVASRASVDDRLQKHLKGALIPCLQADPDKRPTARELGKSLQEVTVSLGHPASAMIVFDSSSKWSRQESETEREHGEILIHSIDASAGTIYRAAVRVEDRLRNQKFVGLSLWSTVAALLVALSETLILRVQGGAWLLWVTGVTLVALAAPAVFYVFDLVARRRASSTSRRALELSARLRNAYLRELRALQARSRRSIADESPVEARGS